MSNDDSTEAGPVTEPAFVVPTPLPADTQIWLIRHGETSWSRSGQHTGRTDVPLTAEGERAARELRGLLSTLRPALVLSSPRQRALRTAELAGLSVDAVEPDLVEWDYGAYEGLTTKQIEQQVPGWSLWTHGVPGGETAGQVAARADRLLRRVAEHVGAGPVLLISHGHFSRVMGARWMGLPASVGGRLAFDTSGLSVLGAEHGTPVLRRWNLLSASDPAPGAPAG